VSRERLVLGLEGGFSWTKGQGAGTCQRPRRSELQAGGSAARLRDTEVTKETRRKERRAMNTMLLGDTQMQVFKVEHAERVREGDRRRLAAQVRNAHKAHKAEKTVETRGFIPRIAGALGLF
jgi:hypothetical protein